MCDLGDESEFGTTDSKYDNTASPTDSESSTERVNSDVVSKAKNGNIGMVENSEEAEVDYKN